MKRIALLGSTGSIGRQTLEVIDSLGPEYRVVALTAGSNYEALAEQVKRYKPEMAALSDIEAAAKLSEMIGPEDCLVQAGQKGQLAAATWQNAELVVMAQVGFSGFEPLVAALKEGKMIALSNKESLVIGGEILDRLGLLDRERILPVDSEHSAIWQCLGPSGSLKEINRIFITASGGPFYGWEKDQLDKATPEMALKHPNWQMGKKITIDSATLMNKGLEVIEAKWLFDLDLDQIEVIIEQRSIIHAMVEYIDGSIIAHLGRPDMKLPIQYALTYPERKASRVERYNPFGESLRLGKPDRESFPCLELAYSAARSGGTMPAVLSAANEVAVENFLSGSIKFTQIPLIIDRVIKNHTIIERPGIDDIIEVDGWSRLKAAEVIDDLTGRVI